VVEILQGGFSSKKNSLECIYFALCQLDNRYSSDVGGAPSDSMILREIVILAQCLEMLETTDGKKIRAITARCGFVSAL
jgi:hypothetical protein